jgi:uncharacterized protein (DUF433 family)
MFRLIHSLHQKATTGNTPTNVSSTLKVCIFDAYVAEYIISDKQVLLGKPIIKGTRISVELILELLASGWTERQLLESYPNLSEDALRAVFLYDARCIQQESIFPFQLLLEMFLANENFPRPVLLYKAVWHRSKKHQEDLLAYQNEQVLRIAKENIRSS